MSDLPESIDVPIPADATDEEVEALQDAEVDRVVDEAIDRDIDDMLKGLNGQG
jgi:hypothetical protein